MSQLLLFAIGTGVFCITLLATLFYGYFTFNRLYNLSVAADEALALARLVPEPPVEDPPIRAVPAA